MENEVRPVNQDPENNGCGAMISLIIGIALIVYVLSVIL